MHVNLLLSTHSNSLPSLRIEGQATTLSRHCENVSFQRAGCCISKKKFWVYRYAPAYNRYTKKWRSVPSHVSINLWVQRRTQPARPFSAFFSWFSSTCQVSTDSDGIESWWLLCQKPVALNAEAATQHFMHMGWPHLWSSLPAQHSVASGV